MRGSVVFKKGELLLNMWIHVDMIYYSIIDTRGARSGSSNYEPMH